MPRKVDLLTFVSSSKIVNIQVWQSGSYIFWALKVQKLPILPDTLGKPYPLEKYILIKTCDFLSLSNCNVVMSQEKVKRIMWFGHS